MNNISLYLQDDDYSELSTYLNEQTSYCEKDLLFSSQSETNDKEFVHNNLQKYSLVSKLNISFDTNNYYFIRYFFAILKTCALHAVHKEITNENLHSFDYKLTDEMNEQLNSKDYYGIVADAQTNLLNLDGEYDQNTNNRFQQDTLYMRFLVNSNFKNYIQNNALSKNGIDYVLNLVEDIFKTVVDHPDVSEEYKTSLFFEDHARSYEYFERNINSSELRSFNEIVQEEELDPFEFIKDVRTFLKKVLYEQDKVNYQQLNKYQKQEKTILSNWSESFVDQFDFNKVTTLDDYFSINSYASGYISNCTTAGSRSYVETMNLSKKVTQNSKDSFRFGNLSSFTMLSEKQDYFKKSSDTSVNLKELIQSKIDSTPGKIQGFIFNSFSRDSSKPFLEIKDFTKNQLSSRKGIFFPILVPIKYINSENKVEKAYYFAFATFTTLQEIKAKKKSKECFLEFFELYSVGSGLYFYDLEKYNSKLLEFYGKDSFKYSSEIFKVLKSFTKDQLLKFKESAKNQTPYKPFDSITNSALTYQPILPEKLKQRYSKIETRHKELKDKYFAAKGDNKNLSMHLNSILAQKNRLEIEFKNTIAILQAKEKEAKNLKIKIQENLQLLEDSAPLYKKSQKLFSKVQQEKTEAISLAIKENEYEGNSFFNSLAKQNLKIISITLAPKEDKDSPSFTITDFKQIKSTFYQLLEKFNILKVIILIDRPVKLTVDSKPNKFVYGGPYLVEIMRSNIDIALAYSNSIVAKSPSTSDTYIVHPHAGRSSFENVIINKRYQRACLGEASPLLYKAFEKNDLKHIIFSAMTWITSANSTDYWGKDWVHFPRTINDQDQEQDQEPVINQTQEVVESDSDLISESDVDNFLDAVEEEEIEEEQVTAQETVTENTYVRYTQL